MKQGRVQEKNIAHRSKYDWLEGQHIELDGTLYSISNINKTTSNCTITEVTKKKCSISNVDCEEVYLNILESIKEKCKLHSRLFYYPSSSTQNINLHRTPRLKKSTTPNGGTTNIFILNSNQDTNSYQNALSQVVLDCRITASALDYGYKFTGNTNLNHIDR